MSQRSYGFALVGGGVISPIHVQAIAALPNAELRAIVDIDPATAAKRGAELSVEAYTALEPILARDDIDVVVIATPTGHHAELGVQAAGAGKHVIVEKPIDVSLEAADRLIGACRAAGVKLTVISQRRWDPGVLRLKQALDDGELGAVLLAQATMPWYRSQDYYESAAWRGTWELDGGGALMNQGVHFVDLLLWLIGPVARVYATAATVAHAIPVEDVALVHLSFRNGALGVIAATTAAYPGFPECIEVIGTRGTVRVEQGHITLWGIGDAPAPVQGLAQPSAASNPALLASEGHRRQIADFLLAIEEDREPAVRAEDARAALEVILAAYTSAARQMPVDLPLAVPARPGDMMEKGIRT
jgi:UDP-N-acetyl-2-amino-2-deoxyglucuronate dehydrogenase